MSSDDANPRRGLRLPAEQPIGSPIRQQPTSWRPNRWRPNRWRRAPASQVQSSRWPNSPVSTPLRYSSSSANNSTTTPSSSWRSEAAHGPRSRTRSAHVVVTSSNRPTGRRPGPTRPGPAPLEPFLARPNLRAGPARSTPLPAIHLRPPPSLLTVFGCWPMPLRNGLGAYSAETMKPTCISTRRPTWLAWPPSSNGHPSGRGWWNEADSPARSWQHEPTPGGWPAPPALRCSWRTAKWLELRQTPNSVRHPTARGSATRNGVVVGCWRPAPPKIPRTLLAVDPIPQD